MELPQLGKNCTEKSCNQLDFLPMRCDACNEIFCSEHFSYARHSCSSSQKKDVQVPVCPLCGEPVPTPCDTLPDQTVGEHIDKYCKSETKKIFNNRCSYKNCKRKELVPVQCSTCKINFCLRHRHTSDHDCKGTAESQRHLAAMAAETRKHRDVGVNKGPKSHLETVQGSMSEDEALAKALALSIMELDESGNHNRVVQHPDYANQENRDRCVLS